MLLDKLRQIEERSQEIARRLADPAIFSQQAEYARLRKEHADSLEIVERFGEYREVLKKLSEARHILAEDGDRELQELAQAEVDELSGRQTATRRRCSPAIWPACTRSTPSASAGRSR
jgi:peptide chain release factor 1